MVTARSVSLVSSVQYLICKQGNGTLRNGRFMDLFIVCVEEGQYMCTKLYRYISAELTSLLSGPFLDLF